MFAGKEEFEWKRQELEWKEKKKKKIKKARYFSINWNISNLYFYNILHRFYSYLKEKCQK